MKRLLFVLFLSFSFNATLLVPQQYSTIQSAIDASSDGDTVFVAAGTYYENINFNGKNISVIGEDRETTIIDGGGNERVVKFYNGESESAFLSGFTITNGEGGILMVNSSSPTLENLKITNNSAVNLGGGISCHDSSPVIENVIISDNYVINSDWWMIYGGGVFLGDNSNPIIKNSIIADNYLQHNSGGGVDGGGIYCENSSPSLINVTISNNTDGGIVSGGAHPLQTGDDMNNRDSNLILINSIVWNNGINISEGSLVATYSNIITGWDGEGNINADPQFTDPDNGDYTLQPTSPCIDAGDPNSEPDLDGTIADMGAYYFNQVPIEGCTDSIACNYDENANIDDDSCIYAEENFDCDGNCISEIDCLGDCGGYAIIDNCGVCDGDGSTCDNILLVPFEYSSIQNAINASSNGDTVLVSNGIYYENISFGDNNITLKSANGPEATIIDGLNNGRVFDNFGVNINLNTTISGFTIQHGYTASDNNGNGAGIYTLRDFKIENCIIKNNTCSGNGSGGGIFAQNTSMIIDNCEFYNNSGNEGGAIRFSNDIGSIVRNSKFHNNNANTGSSIEYLYNSSGHHKIINCEFYDEYRPLETEQTGYTDSLSIINTSFHNITSLLIDAQSLEYINIENCLFENTNEIITTEADYVNISNSLFNNITRNPSGAIFRFDNGYEWTFINNTMYDINLASNSCEIFKLENGDLQIKSSIIWAENIIDIERYFEINNVSNTNIDIWYSDFAIELPMGYGLLGNIVSDPLFVDADNYDFSLQPVSPCIDTGDPDSDLDPDGSRADMGALYFDQNENPIFYGCMDEIACNYDENANVDDNSCVYVEENFDCDGNCISEIDCDGVCGGESIIDECGICGGFNECLGCTDPYASNYNEDATIDDGSCVYYEDTFEFIFQPVAIYNPDNTNTTYYLDIRAQSSTLEVAGIQMEIQDIPNLIRFDWYGSVNNVFDFVEINDNGSLSFVMLNTNQDYLTEEEFLLIRLGFILDEYLSEEDYGEWIGLILENILVGDFNANPIQPLSNEPTVDIGYKGDVSLDGSINVSDIISGVNIILNTSTPSDYQLWACDLNEDLYHNIYDIILIINLILGN